MKLNAKQRLLTWHVDKLSIHIQVHAIACSNGILFLPEFNGNQAIRAPRYYLVHVYLIIF